MFDYERMMNERRFEEYNFRVVNLLGIECVADDDLGGIFNFPRGFPFYFNGIPADQLLVDDGGNIILR